MNDEKKAAIASDPATKWFPAPGIIARRGDELILNESNLGDEEIVQLGLLVIAGLGRYPTPAEAEVVATWAARARRAGGTEGQCLDAVLQLDTPLVPVLDPVQGWLIMPQIPPELSEELN